MLNISRAKNKRRIEIDLRLLALAIVVAFLLSVVFFS